MAFSKNVIWLLVLLCLGWSKPGLAQQASPPVSLGASQPLLNAADTVAALQDLFQTKRKSSGLALVAAPVALGLGVVSMAVAALSNLDSGPSDNTLPTIGVLAGLGGTVALLSRYTRYTKGNEKEILSKYERTHKLPGWAKRNLAQQRLGPL
ncbi:hypothetical protein [Hymenobacter sedentarius]|uniref:hypothetical protein n=1 Tax=Hymenobacter sedentarius TaxID=1411621 RepID=UPI000A617DA3|nr:hypothetical protein [Hymenobacter sedentarius]